MCLLIVAGSMTVHLVTDLTRLRHVDLVVIDRVDLPTVKTSID
jgi:hypothetical protein